MKNRKTVLYKLGITDNKVRLLRKEGIFVRKKRIPPKEERMISPSEKIIVEWADKWTPLLSRQEKRRYFKNPRIFAEEAIKSGKLMRKLSIILLKALDNFKKLDDEEVLAGCLAILRIYYDSFDYQIYKYDRHFEFHQYAQSPVGFIWQSLDKLIKNSLKKAGKTEEEVQKLFFDLISFPKGESLSLKYQDLCRKLYQNLKKKRFSGLKEQKIWQITKDSKEFESLFKKAEKFYKLPSDFISDALKTKDKKIKIDKTKTNSQKAKDEIAKYLSPRAKNNLNFYLHAIDNFNKAQETVYFIMASKSNDDQPIRNAEFKTFDIIKDLIDKNPQLVKERYRRKVLEIFNKKGLEAVIAPVMLITEGENKHYFIPSVEKLYWKELNRWI